RGFSTRELVAVGDRIRAELTRNRPRATPRLLLFVYPGGRITAERLKTMTAVEVEVQLIMDPCERSVCREAVARHIEMVGRAVGKAVLQAPGYRVEFKQLTLQVSADVRGSELEVYRVPIADCIQAAARPQGGLRWLDAMK